MNINHIYFFISLFFFFSTNLISDDKVYMLSGCKYQQEYFDLSVDTFNKSASIARIYGSGTDQGSQWVTVFNPFSIVEINGRKIKAHSYFSELYKQAGNTSGDMYEGSKKIVLEQVIDLDAGHVLMSIRILQNSVNTYKDVQNIKSVLNEFEYKNPTIQSGSVIEQYLYTNCSVKIIKDYQRESEDLQNQKLQEKKLEIERLKLEVELKETRRLQNIVPEFAGSGTGFNINNEGYIVTNYHVIHGCEEIKSGENRLKLLITDPINDLAVLKSDINSDHYITFSKETAIKSQDIYVIGFPFGKHLSAQSKTTKGIVSSLQGLNNSYNWFQMDASIQPGNSGGPIVDNNGYLKGITVATADYKVIFEWFEELPQNINFGIKADILKNILGANDILYNTEQEPSIWEFFSSRTQEELLEKVDKSTIYIECWAKKTPENEKKFERYTLLKSS